MKNLIVLILVGLCFSAYSQIDRDQLSLDISKADAANMEQLQDFIWKKASVVTVDGEVKLNTLTEFSFDGSGELQTKNIDAETTVKQKRGIRGKIQQNAAEDNVEYVQEALDLALAYTFMTKGQLIDFFGKAELTWIEGNLQASAGDVYVKGDTVTFLIEAETNLFLHKKFASYFGEKNDPVSGEIQYGKFSSGVSHATGSVLNLPSKKAVITSKNQDYTKRVQ